VVEIIEDIDDYRRFESAIIADYDARTAVERELVLRLASLLWRLRRAPAIETDLMRIRAEILRDRGQGRVPEWSNDMVSLEQRSSVNCGSSKHRRPQPVSSARHLTLCFQRLANFDNGLFERLGRYESALAGQVLKTLYC
jgi:hypothetical protein